MKRRMKDLDLPGVSRGIYDCPFCELEIAGVERIVEENELALCIRDLYPVTTGHSLVIPKRHVLDFFELDEKELLCINRLLVNQRQVLFEADSSIEGFNVGANCGITAGQSVWHCHIHLIPRRKGDTDYPKGGVRHVVPLKDSIHFNNKKSSSS